MLVMKARMARLSSYVNKTVARWYDGSQMGLEHPVPTPELMGDFTLILRSKTHATYFCLRQKRTFPNPTHVL